MYNVVLKMNNTLFGKGKEKILECFYRNRNKELYFSEILRETKLTQNTTLKHLANLQKLGLIISTKKIGNTFYKINSKNQLIFSIFSYFDYKKINELPFERRKAISDFLDKIKVKPLIATIFGSTAKGTFGKESDIDILLIYNKKELKEFNDWAIVSAYYSIYHASLALCALKGYSTKDHLATLLILIKEFYKKQLDKEEIEMVSKTTIEKGEVLYYIEAKSKRTKASYSTKILFDEKEAEILQKKAIGFVNKVKEIIDSNF